MNKIILSYLLHLKQLWDDGAPHPLILAHEKKLLELLERRGKHEKI